MTRCVLNQELKTCGQTVPPSLTHLVAHVRLIVKACWRTEDLAVCVHKFQFVPSDVHGINRSLQ